MTLEYTCTNTGRYEWEELMKDVKPLNYAWLKARIKRLLPELYESLNLDLYNPWHESTFKTKNHYILTHSGIEYFLTKD